MSKIVRLLKNPLLLIVPVVVLLMLAWQQYTEARTLINSSQVNILPNAGLDILDDSGFPAGWQFSPSSTAVTAESNDGYNSPRLLKITNRAVEIAGNTTLTSPVASVQKGATYFYKGFYTSTVPFDLILRVNNKDGSSRQAIVGRYAPDSQWATVSRVFTPDENTQTVQLVYSFAAKGELRIDNNYLEPNPVDTYDATEQGTSKNLISDVTETSEGNEQKWQHSPISIREHQAFQYNVTYKSSQPVDVVVEYILPSGVRKYSTIGTLLPAKEWTIYMGTFETPSTATGLVVSVIAQGEGTAVKDHGLYDISKSSIGSWKKPMISITFDDGWKSAFTNGIASLDKYDYKATFYLNPSSIDTSGFSFITSEEVAALKEGGHELASHGYQHHNLTTLDTPSIDYQLEFAYRYFKQIHEQQDVSVSTPFGGTDSQVRYYARKYYASLRGTESGINTRHNFNPYNLLVLYIGNDTQPSKLAEALAEAKDRNGWLILVYHRIDTNTEGEPVVSPAQFQRHLEIVDMSGVTVFPIAAALREIDSQAQPDD